jgi:predicted amidophosphoribosyltransferase
MPKLHAHFCADCGNDWQCERDWCSDITGEISRECPSCYEKRIKAGFNEAEIGG